MTIECISEGEKMICRAVVHPELWTWEWVLLSFLGILSGFLIYSTWRHTR